MQDPADISQAQQCHSEAKAIADAERAKVSAAELAASDAQVAHEAAKEALRAKPNALNATALLVAAQIRDNAIESLEAAKLASKPALEAESLAGVRVTYTQRLAEFQTYRLDLDRDVALIVEAEATIRAAVARIYARSDRHRVCQQDLEASINALNLPPVGGTLIEPQYLRDLVTRALHTKYGAMPISIGEVRPVSEWIGFY